METIKGGNNHGDGDDNDATMVVLKIHYHDDGIAIMRIKITIL